MKLSLFSFLFGFCCVACSFCCVACGDPGLGNHYDVQVDSSADPTVVEALLTAVDAWTSTTAVTLKVSVGNCTGDNGRICVHTADHAAILALHGSDSTWGETRAASNSLGLLDGADIYVDVSAVPSARLPVVLEHELGHAMGLGHSGSGTVMCSHDSCVADHVTPADVQQFNDIRR